MSFYPPKFSDDFFLVIASDFQNFYPDFSNFDHFSPKMSYFLQKTTKKMYFRANFKKTQEEPKIASKNPRSWEKTQAVATLNSTILREGRNRKSALSAIINRRTTNK